jgi:hypothetical protein
VGVDDGPADRRRPGYHLVHRRARRSPSTARAPACRPSEIRAWRRVLWGSVWLVSAFFNSVAIALATTYADPEGVRFLTLLGLQSVLVLTPALTIALLGATGVAVLASPTFPRRFGYMTLGSAAFRLVLSILDWCGSAELAMRIMVLTLIWIVVTGIHLLGATRPASATPELMA